MFTFRLVILEARGHFSKTDYVLDWETECYVCSQKDCMYHVI